MYLVYCCDKCGKEFTCEHECYKHEENCTNNSTKEINNGINTIVNIKCELNGAEEIKNMINELQEKVNNIKINICL